MTLDIPVWLLYVAGLGALAVVLVLLFVIGGLTFSRWLFEKTWRPPWW
jgi:hypothetical protein